MEFSQLPSLGPQLLNWVLMTEVFQEQVSENPVGHFSRCLIWTEVFSSHFNTSINVHPAFLSGVAGLWWGTEGSQPDAPHPMCMELDESVREFCECESFKLILKCASSLFSYWRYLHRGDRSYFFSQGWAKALVSRMPFIFCPWSSNVIELYLNIMVSILTHWGAELLLSLLYKYLVMDQFDFHHFS